MNRLSYTTMHDVRIRLGLRAGAAGLALMMPAIAHAQTQAPMQPQGGFIQQIDPAGERLAQDMRRLADDPRDVEALLSAGRGSLAMDDANAALGFFLRAQDAAPFDGRAKAGMGSALVQLERPADALRMFQDAARQGVADGDMAGDRGLAFDLVGDQARAQRDYALALTRRSDDEITRRYALSLGISGRRQEALAMLDPLLRKQDRGAWRARAFVLAMAGDEGEAQKIARQSLPAGLAQMLTPYFEKLDDLGPGERAFAVHYGQLGGDAARLAKQSAPTPTGPVMLAATTPPPRVIAARTASAIPPRKLTRAERRAAERRAKAERLAAARDFPANARTIGTAQRLVSATPAVVPAPAVRRAALVATPGRVAVATVAPPTTVVARTSAPPAAVVARAVTSTAPAPAAVGGPAPARVAATAPAGVPASTLAATVAAPRVFGPPASTVAMPGFSLSALPTRVTPPAASVPAAPVSALVPAPAPVAVATAAAAPAAVAPTPVAAPPAAAPSRAERTALLASIVAGITVPAEELAARPMVDAETLEKARVAAATRRRREAEAKRVADAKATADAAAKAKATADAAAKKKADAELAARKKATPERHWVQIATGGNPAALARDFAKLRARAPVLRGQAAWSARFGGTRRMLVGPFASQRAAVQFMQKAKAAGVEGFNWTSPEGTDVEKLPAA